MKNMKFKVETNKLGESNLDEIVGELERLGYKQWGDANNPKFIITHKSGLYQMIWNDMPRLKDWGLTTLAELKGM